MIHILPTQGASGHAGRSHIAAIQDYIDTHNQDPKPYVWTATAESILAKVARARTTLNTIN
ncbi:hypothetical protein [Mycobacterium riyadhense]|uniref:hypothetical protein n=1 Tax=Mycobacterium riyadhense TaxID=486698 RepID=UPI00195CD0A6|nr:hypothetical protein [Mycobacterium riyadhense]